MFLSNRLIAGAKPQVQRLSAALGGANNLDVPLSKSASGNLRILIFYKSAGDDSINTPSGWTSIFQSGFGPASGLRVAVFHKTASESDGDSVNVSITGRNRNLRAFSYLIRRWNSASAPEIATTDVESATASGNPPSLSPSWGSAPTAWIAFDGAGIVSGQTFTSFPSGYDGERVNFQLASAHKKTNSSPEDPGNFEWGLAVPHIVGTIGIRLTS